MTSQERRDQIDKLCTALEAEIDQLNRRLAELDDEDMRLWIEQQNANEEPQRGMR